MEIADKKLNHPKGITPLFLTEMWERMSYYGMRAILVLYLVVSEKKTDEEAGQIYALYTAFVYLTPVLGGYITERFFGYKQAIYLGAFLMMFGHLSLAIPDSTAFYVGLVLLGLGNGFFKPNISTVFGRLYEEKKELKDSGYTIFYMGINLGGLLGPLFCGLLAESVDWHLGFLAAGIGMGIGVLIFYFGTKDFDKNVWEWKGTAPLNSSENLKSIPGFNSSHLDTKRIYLIILLSFFSIFFWMSFEQMGSSLNLFALRYTDREIFGIEIPASFLQSVNPLFILLLAPVLSFFWSALSQRNLNPNPVLKFAIGLFIMGFGFLIMVFASELAESGTLVSIWFLIAVYFWNTISELFLSPVGLSFVSKTAPKGKTSLLMGVWFLCTAFGHYLAGILSGFQRKMGSLSDFYFLFVISSILAGLLLLGIYYLKRQDIQKLLRD